MTPISTTSPHEFGIALKRTRRAAHLTQAQLAEAAGFSVVYISMLERGARQPQRSTIILLADALDLPADERAAFESAVQPPAMNGVRRRRDGDHDDRDDRDTAHLPVGGFLGALPADRLVGRQRELVVFGEALAAVGSGQGRLLVLVGEPGAGKTRLAQELTLQARALDFRVLTGRCYEPQQTVAYYPFLEALALAEAGADPLMRDQLPERWPEVARLLPERLTDTQPAQLDDRNAQQRLFWQVTGFLGALTERTPLAVLLDDIHWADSASLDLLQHLARRLHELPVLLVGTTREVEARRQHPLADALSDLSRDEIMLKIPVHRLAVEETGALIGATLGFGEGAAADPATVSPQLAEIIHQRTEGNAFFIRQLARALREQDELLFAGGRWRLRATSSATLPAPESVRVVIGQRLSRLTPHTQDVLREASVLGQVFAFDELRSLGGRGEQEIEEALEEAVSVGIVREGAPDRYGFNHALTLDTLAAELPARRRRRLHLQAAAALEQAIAHVPNRERRAAELSYHFREAGESERALPYTLLAGDQAEAVYAYAEAERHYRVALDMARELGAAAQEAKVLERLGVVVGALGRHRESADILGRALRAYQELDEQLGELRALARLLQAQAEEGREKLEEAVALARTILARIQPADVTAITSALASALAAAHSSLGWILFTSGLYADAQAEERHAVDLARAANDEAGLAMAQFRLLTAGGLEQTVAAYEETLTLAERSGQITIVVTSHNMIAFKYVEAGDFARAMTHMEQSVAAAEQRQDPRHLAWQLHNFAEFLLDYGDWQRARDVFARAEEIMGEADRHGETWQSAAMSIVPGELALRGGNEDEGRRLLEEAIERIAQVGSVYFLQFPVYLLAEADLLADHAGQARYRLTMLLNDSRRMPTGANIYHSHLLLAWSEIALGQYEDAETRLNNLLADATPLIRADALRVKGLLAARRQHWEDARKALDEAIALCRAMPYPYAEAKALWVYGQFEAARSDPAAARKHHKQALAICDRLGEGLYRKHIERDLQSLARMAY